MCDVLKGFLKVFCETPSVHQAKSFKLAKHLGFTELPQCKFKVSLQKKYILLG